MAASVRALLGDILDYAGLFPPATLELDEAIRNYARYCQEPEAWMLGRFLCPVSRLGELAPYVAELFGAGPILRLSVLGRGGQTRERFLEGTRIDLKDLAEFCEHQNERTVIEAFELRLPGDLKEEGEVLRLLDTVSEQWGEQGVSLAVGGPTFYESASAATDRRSTWSAIISGIARSNESRTAAAAGFKLRCGGSEAATIPSVEQVAEAISLTHAARVPMKFTAGLHHPLRHYNEAMHADMHGFINVFTAGAVADSRDVNEEQLCEILGSKDVESFEFQADALSWRGIRITCDEMASARRQAVTSFGSCSFDEARGDLRNLGLL